MAVTEEHVPSPADAPQFTAEELLATIHERGGRIFRMPEVSVFVLTQDEDLAHWLMRLGGKSFLPRHLAPADLGPKRAYKRTPAGPWEWDVYVHTIPVKDEMSIHEAAKAYRVNPPWKAEWDESTAVDERAERDKSTDDGEHP